MPAKRTERVGVLLRAALSELLLRDVKDPRVRMVTVTEVDVSPDLKHARCYVSLLGGGGDAAAMLKGLASARPYLQSQVGKRLGLRFTPELHFEIDTSLDAADRMQRLLRGLDADRERDDGDG